jgi:TM2 domain-containing membrane protein YozV
MKFEKAHLAALLSLIVPGAGQLYNGALLRALFWFVITPGFWVGSGGLLGWVCHVISAYTAYQYAVARRSEGGGFGRVGSAW